MRGTEAPQNKVKAIQTLQREKEVERELYLRRVAQLDEEISCCARSINEQLPIMSLPAEILLSIFKLAVDFKTPCSTVSEPDEDPHYCHTALDFDNDCVSGRKAEFDISQVCHEWRALALGCSELWTTFNYIGDEWNFSNLRLPLYLERSRQRLLDLRLYFPPEYARRIPSIMEMLLPHVLRWRLLCVRVDRGKDQHAFLDSMTVAGPISPQNLEVLELYNPGDFMHREATSFRVENKIIFKDNAAPKLTRLRLRTPAYRIFFPFSSHSITFLQIDRVEYMTTQELEYILRLPALVSLSLSDGETDTHEKPSQPVLAPNLRYFRYSSQSEVFCLWQFLKAPRLELLILKDAEIGFQGGGWSNPIAQQECGHFPSLSTVSLINCGISHSDADDFLLHLARATPNVTRLMIVDSELSYELQTLIPQMLEHQDVIYWPNLTEVFYCDLMLDEEDIKSTRTQLAEMLISQSTALKLKVHCTYHVRSPYLDVLLHDEFDDRWESLQKGKFHEVICSDVTEEVPEWCSWPRQLSADFYYSPEADLDQHFEIVNRYEDSDE